MKKDTYTIRIRVGASVLAEIAAVECVSVVHVGCTDLFLLLLCERSFFMHAATELVSPIALGPIITITNETVLLTSFFASLID